MRRPEEPVLVLALLLGIGSLIAASGCRPAPGTCTVPAGDDLARMEPICQLLDDSVGAVRHGTVLLGDASGRKLTWSRGDIGPDTPVELASASKWLAAATLLRLVERGVLRLEDRPQDHLSFATDDDDDPRSRIALAHLLAFTSGLEIGPFDRSCVADGSRTVQDCAEELYAEVHEREPGTGFYYGPAHLHLAGAMAEAATGRAFADLFRDEIADPLALSSAAAFRSPSRTNPRVSGGGVASATDYGAFLLALVRGELLPDLAGAMHDDHTPSGDVAIVESPVTPFDLEWHYAFGSWRECPSEEWEERCAERRISSSPGAFGFMPWIDWGEETWGIIAVKRSILAQPSRDSVFLAFDLRPLFADALGR